jgi:recombination protein RecT
MTELAAHVQRKSAAGARAVLLSEIDKHKTQIAQYLPDQTQVDRFIALARKAVIDNPDITDCATVSVLKALGACAASGLQLDGKFSSLIVRRPKQGKPTAQWDPTYRGLTSLALESGHVLAAHAQVVREGDEFHVELGSEPKLVHRPALDGKGAVIAAYAVATLRGGGIVHEVLTKHDLQKIRAQSPAGDKGPWGSWADEMSKKSAMRRLLKRLPAGVVRPVAFADTEPTSHTLPPRNAQAHVLPEDENALECASLERITNADTQADLEAAWAQTIVDYDTRGIAVPVRVEACYNDRREAIAQRADENY